MKMNKSLNNKKNPKAATQNLLKKKYSKKNKVPAYKLSTTPEYYKALTKSVKTLTVIKTPKEVAPLFRILKEKAHLETQMANCKKFK
jgi:hypothetical protein